MLMAEDAALGRVNGEGEKVRRFAEFDYAARSWKVARRASLALWPVGSLNL